MTNLTIRPERFADVAAITNITREAFCGHPHSSHTEEFIIEALRRENALTISLVAEREGEVVGHIAFSPVDISDGSQNWYGLGPMAVKPTMQRGGIGRDLIVCGLALLREIGAEGCVILGEREFYGRFGFRNRKELTLAGVPAEYFLQLPFAAQLPVGQVTYHVAFNATGGQ